MNPAIASSDAGPDHQSDALQLDLAVEGIFDERLVLVLIGGKINEKWQRDRGRR